MRFPNEDEVLAVVLDVPVQTNYFAVQDRVCHLQISERRLETVEAFVVIPLSRD